MSPRELDAGPGSLERELLSGGAAPKPAAPQPASRAGAEGKLCYWSLLYDIPEIVSSRSLRPDDVAATTLEAAVRVAGADQGLLLLHDRSRDLAVRAAVGLSRDFDPASPEGAAVGRLIEEALRSDRPAVKEHVSLRGAGGGGAGSRTAIALPLRGVIRDGAAAAPLEAASGAASGTAFVERRRLPQEGLVKQLGAIYVDRDAARPFAPDEIERVQAFAEHAARALLLARLYHTATVDPLTGFSTRAELEQSLSVEMTVATHLNLPLAVLMVDIGRFQELVYARGRRWADEALAEVAARLRRSIRDQDPVFRYGGGKFIALLPGAGEESAIAAAGRIVTSCETAAPGSDGARLTAYCGIAVFPHHADRKGDLLKKADQALFLAESGEGTKAGGGAFAVWHRGISKYALRTDKLCGIISGDPDRDYRNVLLLLDAIAVVNSIRERAPLLSTIVDMMIELTEAERGIVFIPEPAAAPAGERAAERAAEDDFLEAGDTRRLLAQAALDSAGPQEPVQATVGGASRLVVALAQDAQKRRITADQYCRSVVEKVARTGLPVSVLDYMGEDDPAVEDRIRELGLRLVISIPLEVQNRLAGVLYLDGRTAAREVGEADLIFFQALAREIAVALENSRLYEENLRGRHEVEELNRKLARKVRKQAHELEEAKAVLEVELKTKYDYDKIVGKSARMQEIYRLLDRITDTEAPVLIQGESGTGKELVAKAIHYNGPRKRKRFVSVNCAAIAPTLLESELFGHVKGSFTGADRDKPGLFEQADQGTIFLDEVQDMPPQLQRELLRVLQEKEVRRVGGKEVIPVNVRVISASNRDLKDLMRRSVFREDLYYRMAVVTIDIPPLRDRKEDIPLIIERYLRDLCRTHGRPPLALDKAALRRLLRHDWPGNVRELNNVLERAFLMVDGDVIGEDAIDIEVREPFTDRKTPIAGTRAVALPAAAPAAAAPAASSAAPAEAAPAPLGPGLFGMSYKDAAEAFKAEYIRRLLAQHGGNVTRASEQSGLFRSSLHKIMRKLDVSARDIRSSSGERRSAD